MEQKYKKDDPWEIFRTKNFSSLISDVEIMSDGSLNSLLMKRENSQENSVKFLMRRDAFESVNSLMRNWQQQSDFELRNQGIWLDYIWITAHHIPWLCHFPPKHIFYEIAGVTSKIKGFKHWTKLWWCIYARKTFSSIMLTTAISLRA